MSLAYDVIIVGSGPAGLSAGLYTSRAGLSTLILEKETMGGELMNREMIENYPGYSEGIMGPDLGSNMTTQTMNYGSEIKMAEVTNIDRFGFWLLVGIYFLPSLAALMIAASLFVLLRRRLTTR